MKTLLLSSALAFSSFLSFAQMPVPTGDFENWSTGTCGDKPTGYTTYAEIIKESSPNCVSSDGITQSTTKYTGTYALQLSALVNNVNVGGTIIPVPSANSIFLGSSPSNQGSIFNGRPTKFIGYTKFSKSGSDILEITVDIADAFGNGIATGQLTISSTQSAYTKFEITLDYTTNTNPATKLFISFGISDGTSNISLNTVALIDALSFEYATTPTVNYSATSPLNVYAANKAINFSENVSDIHVVDMVGSQKISETSPLKTLDVASLTTGMYIITYKYNDAYFSKKVVIE